MCACLCVCKSLHACFCAGAHTQQQEIRINQGERKDRKEQMDSVIVEGRKGFLEQMCLRVGEKKKKTC